MSEPTWAPQQSAMLLTEDEWRYLASICWGWKRNTPKEMQPQVMVDLADRIIEASR